MSDETEPIIDEYLHGSLSPDRRAALERQAERDPELRLDIERQRRLDAALARLFVAPPAEQMLARLRAARADEAPAVSKIRRGGLARGAVPSLNGSIGARSGRTAWLLNGLATAAAIVLAIVGVRWLVRPGGSGSSGEVPIAPRSRALDVAYRAVIADGFTPEWECKTDQEFVSTYWWIVGQGLALAKLPEGVEALGVDYGRAITPKTAFLLARVKGREIIVFSDRLEEDRGQSLPPDSGLNFHRRVIGELVLYEVTPLDRAHILDSFKPADMPDEWKKNPPYPGMPR